MPGCGGYLNDFSYRFYPLSFSRLPVLFFADFIFWNVFRLLLTSACEQDVVGSNRVGTAVAGIPDTAEAAVAAEAVQVVAGPVRGPAVGRTSGKRQRFERDSNQLAFPLRWSMLATAPYAYLWRVAGRRAILWRIARIRIHRLLLLRRRRVTVCHRIV